MRGTGKFVRQRGGPRRRTPRGRVAAVGASAALAAGSLPLAAEPAAAGGNIYPAGCDQQGWFINWDDYCWTGISYNRTGPYVGAVQQIVSGLGYFPGGRVDCIFGSRTAQAVLVFQSEYGIAVDGVVGPGTWAELRQVLTFSFTDVADWGGWHYFSSPGRPNYYKYQYFNLFPQDNGWFVRIVLDGEDQFVAMSTWDTSCG